MKSYEEKLTKKRMQLEKLTESRTALDDKIKECSRQITELENLQIVFAVRVLKIPVAKLGETLSSIKHGEKGDADENRSH